MRENRLKLWGFICKKTLVGTIIRGLSQPATIGVSIRSTAKVLLSAKFLDFRTEPKIFSANHYSLKKFHAFYIMKLPDAAAKPKGKNPDADHP
jgi:hypothetical protein